MKQNVAIYLHDHCEVAFKSKPGKLRLFYDFNCIPDAHAMIPLLIKEAPEWEVFQFQNAYSKYVGVSLIEKEMIGQISKELALFDLMLLSVENINYCGEPFLPILLHHRRIELS